jgi:hypothetical protein
MHHLGVSSEHLILLHNSQSRIDGYYGNFKFQSILLAGSSLSGPLANEYQLSSPECEDVMPKLAWFHGEGMPGMKRQHV